MAGMNLSGCGLYYITPYPDDFQITVVYPQFDEGSNYLENTTFAQAQENFKKGSKNILRVVFNHVVSGSDISGGNTSILDLQFVRESNDNYRAIVTGGGSIGPSFYSANPYCNYYIPVGTVLEHQSTDRLSILLEQI